MSGPRRFPRDRIWAVIFRAPMRFSLALAGVLVALLLVEGTLRLTHPRYAGPAAVQWVEDVDPGFHREPGGP